MDALRLFDHALKYESQTSDTLGLALVYLGRGAVQFRLYDGPNQIESVLKAASLYHRIKEPLKELESLRRAMETAIILKAKDIADSINQACEQILVDYPEYESGQVSYRIEYSITFQSPEKVRELLKETESRNDLDKFAMYKIADAYKAIGESRKSCEYFERIPAPATFEDSVRYYADRYYVYKSASVLEEALKSLENFSEATGRFHANQFEENMKFAERSFKKELAHQKDVRAKELLKYSITGILILAVLCGVMFFYRIRFFKMKKKYLEAENKRLEAKAETQSERAKVAELEKKAVESERDSERLRADNLKHQMRELMNEKQLLESKLKDKKRISKEAFEILNERIGMLNRLLKNEIASDEKGIREYNRWISRVTLDREELKRKTVLFYRAATPSFIEYLENHNLSADEIEFVCLYALGLSGKEVGTYLDFPSKYHYTSSIRSKLEIPKSETNMRRYIARLIESLK